MLVLYHFALAGVVLGNLVVGVEDDGLPAAPALPAEQAADLGIR